MTLHTNYTRMTIDMPINEHKQLKAMAAFMGMSLKELVLSCVRENLLSQNKPNAETLKAFKETEKGIGIVECNNFDDFISKLGL